MPVSLSKLSRRYAKVKQQLAEKIQREKLVNCNCRLTTRATPNRPEEFEAEMNLPCPGHTFRKLGLILTLRMFRSKGCFTTAFNDEEEEWDAAGQGIVADDMTRLNELLALYREREARHARLELEEESDEL